MSTLTRKIGMNRGKVRLWLEGSILNTNGFKHGDRFNVENANGRLTITNSPDGKRKIAGKAGREIIDMSAGTITASFPNAVKGHYMAIKATKGKLVITKA